MKRRTPTHADLERWFALLRQERRKLDAQARKVASRVHRRIVEDRSSGNTVRERRVSFGAAAILLVVFFANIVAPRGQTSIVPLPHADAGPIEAKAQLERAKALSIGKHWLVQADAYQDVVRMASSSDPTRKTALRALARTYEKNERTHAALAAFRHMASYGPRKDASRLRALLAYAKALRSEHDLDAARRVAREVATTSGSLDPKLTGKALELLARDAHDAGDAKRLDSILKEMSEFDVPHDVRIRLLGRLGELHLEQDDTGAAKRALQRARGLYAEISKEDDQAARKATKVWMDLPLRKRL